jgi:23S rRNA-/tRNA-specific pseudouridylate synthase
MMTRRIMKTYLAIVTPGAPEPPQGAVDRALRRKEIGRESYMRISDADHPEAQIARTLYRTLARGEAAALIEARPQTGRMHQIRAHLASIGRPIAGDARYGGALMLGGAPAARLMLHAQILEFPHPAGGFRKITAPPPEDFMAALAAAEIEWNAGPIPAIV